MYNLKMVLLLCIWPPKKITMAVLNIYFQKGLIKLWLQRYNFFIFLNIQFTFVIIAETKSPSYNKIVICIICDKLTLIKCCVRHTYNLQLKLVQHFFLMEFYIFNIGIIFYETHFVFYVHSSTKNVQNKK